MHKTADLLRLIGVLTSRGLDGEQMRQRFNRLPDSVMDDFNLPPDARAVLSGMDPGKIGDFLKQELLNWQFPQGEFPPQDPDCAVPGMPVVTTLYPVPLPQLRAVRPQNGAAGTQGFQLTVYGEGFLQSATLKLIPTGGGASLNVTSQNAALQPQGTFRCSRLVATLTLPQAGAYGVHVINVFGSGANQQTTDIGDGSVVFTAQ